MYRTQVIQSAPLSAVRYMFEGGTNFGYWNGKVMDYYYQSLFESSQLRYGSEIKAQLAVRFVSSQVPITTPGSARWWLAMITMPRCLRQETPRRSCWPSEMWLSRYHWLSCHPAEADVLIAPACTYVEDMTNDSQFLHSLEIFPLDPCHHRRPSLPTALWTWRRYYSEKLLTMSLSGCGEWS